MKLLLLAGALALVATPVFADKLYVTSLSGNKLVEHDLTTGRTRDFATGFSQPFDVERGPDGILYVTNHQTGKISKVDSAGTVTTWQTTGETITQPVGITFGPDGSAYVCTYNSRDPLGRGTIKKITAAGVVSTLVSGIPSPTEIFYLSGKLFFSNYGGGNIAMVGEVDIAAKTWRRVVSYSGTSAWGAFGVAADANGDILVGIHGGIRRYTPGSPLIDTMEVSNSSLTNFLIREGSVFATNFEAGKLLRFSPGTPGTPGSFVPLMTNLAGPTGIAYVPVP